MNNAHPLLIQFVDDLSKERNWTEYTKQLRFFCIDNLLRFLKKEPQYITTEDMTSYFLDKKEKERWMNGDTVRNNVWTIKLFFKYLFDKKLIEKIPEIKVIAPRVKYFRLDRDVFKKIRQQKVIIDKSKMDARNKAIWYLLYTSIVLIPDIPKIKLCNINFKNKTIYLDNASDGRIPYIIVSDMAMKAIELYLSKTKINSEYLFPGKDNNMIALGKINGIITTINRKTGVKITHAERIAIFTKIALEYGVDLITLKGLLGVKSLARFNRYLINSQKKLKPFSAVRKMQYGIRRHNYL